MASWVSTAGWADAAQRVLGRSWIVTPRGVVEPAEARSLGSDPSLRQPAEPSWRGRIPTLAKTAVKDARQWQRARRFQVDPDGPWSGTDLAFVWQRHELFHHAGLDLAEHLGLPSVLFAPASLVWEAEQWGVGRHGWSKRLEQAGEGRALRRASLVACGTDLVAEQVHRLGVPESRTIITPTGVDLGLFEAGEGALERVATRARLGLSDRFVVGWVGSFRGFHGLDQLVDAAARLPGATLLLVGDGPERPGVEDRARQSGLATVATGTVPHQDLPSFLAAMDVATVVAPPGRPFHYSPLKLAEYLAAGVAVVAPDVPHLADRLTDGTDALLVTAGDGDQLATALARLEADPDLRHRLGAAGRDTAAAAWSWDHQVERVLARLQASDRPTVGADARPRSAR